MPLITLTTDSGSQPLHAAIAKGKIMNSCSDAVIIDIAHDIKPFNFVEAAFVLKNSFFHFPENTIHIIDVASHHDMNEESEEKTAVPFIALRYKNHFFIGADNGMFSLICEAAPEKIVALNTDRSTTFPLGDVFVPAACRICKNEKLEDLGRTMSELSSAFTLQPAIYESSIKAVVMYVDAYENVYLNVTRHLLESVAKGRRTIISFRREQIVKISHHYGDVSQGEIACFFNSLGYLEIAINKGKASSLLGLKMNDTVHIEFER